MSGGCISWNGGKHNQSRARKEAESAPTTVRMCLTADTAVAPGLTADTVVAPGYSTAGDGGDSPGGSFFRRAISTSSTVAKP